MLMFATVLLRSFIYDMIDVFCFPNKTAKVIYVRYGISKCHLYLNLTDTDSCSLFFIFISEKECNVPESESRKIIFEVLKHSNITTRLDVSDQFWVQFRMRNPKVIKQLGLYEIENIDNVNLCTIAVNPKEYFEKFKDSCE